jgi:nicotinate phosphoribosyltransferase
MATNDLNENRIAALLADGAPIDAFGVGTELATSADAPSLSAVYKLVELRRGESHAYTAKWSEDKTTLPGAKQIYRYPSHDVIALYNECNKEFKGEPLLGPLLIHGELAEPYPSLLDLRERTRQKIAHLPIELLEIAPAPPYRVEISERLLDLAESIRTSRTLVVS